MPAALDCDDSDAAINPDAVEICDGVDNDCDGLVDDADDQVIGQSTWAADLDGDGAAAPDSEIERCEAPEGYVSAPAEGVALDCDDTDSQIYPGAPEVCDGQDQSCDGAIDEGTLVDVYPDADADGWGDGAAELACEAGAGYALLPGDCDEADASINPGASEICDGIDQNCDGAADEGVLLDLFVDSDLDGYGGGEAVSQACGPGDGLVEIAGDCDDDNAAINPDALEVCDLRDNDCDGLTDEREDLPPTASCNAIKALNPEAEDGIYSLDPDGDGPLEPFDAWCDMHTDGGGWTVFQRREDGSVDFYLGWADYVAGFGEVDGEYWLGNDKIHSLTSLATCSLRVDLERANGEQYYASYPVFQLGGADTDYTLLVEGYEGTAPECAPGSGMHYHSGQPFSTRDHGNTGCATAYKGAWWYRTCHYNNLNGYYYGGAHATYADGVEWFCVAGYYESMVFAEMKVR